jgi:hypothetical protein
MKNRRLDRTNEVWTINQGFFKGFGQNEVFVQKPTF